MKKCIPNQFEVTKKYQGSDSHDHHHLEEWFELYSAYSTFDNRLVKVTSINKTKKTFNMEKINGFSLDNWRQLHQLTTNDYKYILKELTSIFSNFFEFEHHLIPNNCMFLHMDIHVGNLMYTDDKKLILIDPDSCFNSVINEPRHMTFYGKYFDCLLYLKEFHK